MKKIFQYALLLAIAGTMSFSFSSCSESDPNSPTNETTEVNLETVTQQYVNDVVFVTYSKLPFVITIKRQERYGKQAKRSSMVLQMRRISTHISTHGHWMWKPYPKT